MPSFVMPFFVEFNCLTEVCNGFFIDVMDANRIRIPCIPKKDEHTMRNFLATE